jgi:chemotaxis protein methyltransferase CheR
MKLSTIPAVATLTDQVSDAQLSNYADLIYRRTGITISPQKKMLLSNRLRRRLRETGLPDFEAYYKLLLKLPAADPEWDAFLQEITTHETFLFRDEAQWTWFRQTYVPGLQAGARQGGAKRVRIWSAACSTGDEAYTAASCLASGLLDRSQWKVEILGTDIGIGAVAQAQNPVFNERAMRLVPETLRKTLFQKQNDEPLWKPRDTLTAMTRFKQHNLLDRLAEPPFDLVIVKNVLIYFDAQSKQQVLKHVKNAVLPGGHLIVGAAEGAGDWLKDWERLQPWLYRRPQ